MKEERGNVKVEHAITARSTCASRDVAAVRLREPSTACLEQRDTSWYTQRFSMRNKCSTRQHAGASKRESTPIATAACLSSFAMRPARYTSHVTRHTSHVTRHTSHVTRHTSHVTHHTAIIHMAHTKHAPPHPRPIAQHQTEATSASCPASCHAAAAAHAAGVTVSPPYPNNHPCCAL